MNETNRNMIIAIVLSVVVIFGWQFFVAGPQMERAQRQAQIAAEQAAAANPGIATTTTMTDPSAPATGTTPAETATAPAGSVAVKVRPVHRTAKVRGCAAVFTTMSTLESSGLRNATDSSPVTPVVEAMRRAPGGTNLLAWPSA